MWKDAPENPVSHRESPLCAVLCGMALTGSRRTRPRKSPRGDPAVYHTISVSRDKLVSLQQ